MLRTLEAPEQERKDDHLKDYVERHPAYAQIAASRVQGHAHLYGTDFAHQHYVTITIRRSELHRSLNSDRASARDELIEVALSEAQWATFVSTLNSGMGVQCTMLMERDQQGKIKMVPGIIPVTQRHAQFAGEMKATLQKAREYLKKARQVVFGAKISNKLKEEIDSELSMVEMNIGSNVEFVAKQFDSHMTNTTEQAKTEIHAYAENVLRATGVKALKGPAQSPIQLKE